MTLLYRLLGSNGFITEKHLTTDRVLVFLLLGTLCADVEMVDEDKKISTSGRKDANHAKHKMAKEDRKKKNKTKLSKREMKKKSTFFRFHK